jgi:DNA polymerase-1
MEFPVQGLLIPADAEIGGRSWGSVLELEASKH